MEFGKGFIRPGIVKNFYDGRGIIMIYALSASCAKEVIKPTTDSGSGSGWEGRIEERAREIYASNRGTKSTRFFSLKVYRHSFFCVSCLYCCCLFYLISS